MLPRLFFVLLQDVFTTFLNNLFLSLYVFESIVENFVYPSHLTITFQKVIEVGVSLSYWLPNLTCSEVHLKENIKVSPCMHRSHIRSSQISPPLLWSWFTSFCLQKAAFFFLHFGTASKQEPRLIANIAWCQTCFIKMTNSINDAS